MPAQAAFILFQKTNFFRIWYKEIVNVEGEIKVITGISTDHF